MRCTLQSRPRTGNRVELSDHRFWAECSDKGLSTQYFRPNLRPIYHDVERCQIRITQGKGHKDRQVPFPLSFRELLALHMKGMREKGAIYLFESARKHKYTDRGVRKMLARYAQAAGITRSVSPHKWRHFLFTWLNKQGIDDALIQPY